MPNIRNISVRFNINNPEHQRAWDYLKNFDKGQYKSYSDVVIKAISSHFERQKQLDDDPYLETRSKEDEFVNKIVESVEQKIEKALPAFLLTCLASYSVQPKTEIADNPEEVNAKSADIDWSFVGDE